jgi:hypothetical protein
MTIGVHRSDLQTSVRRLDYDFETRCGVLHMGAICCTDMNGCIRLFQRIDPQVRTIYTFSVSIEDTAYYRKEGTDLWSAVMGRFDYDQFDADYPTDPRHPGSVCQWASFPLLEGT